MLFEGRAKSTLERVQPLLNSASLPLPLPSTSPAAHPTHPRRRLSFPSRGIIVGRTIVSPSRELTLVPPSLLYSHPGGTYRRRQDRDRAKGQESAGRPRPSSHQERGKKERRQVPHGSSDSLQTRLFDSRVEAYVSPFALSIPVCRSSSSVSPSSTPPVVSGLTCLLTCSFLLFPPRRVP